MAKTPRTFTDLIVALKAQGSTVTVWKTHFRRRIGSRNSYPCFTIRNAADGAILPSTFSTYTVKDMVAQLVKLNLATF